jgi:hypothetical protein
LRWRHLGIVETALALYVAGSLHALADLR